MPLNETTLPEILKAFASSPTREYDNVSPSSSDTSSGVSIVVNSVEFSDTKRHRNIEFHTGGSFTFKIWSIYL